jgi:hypothetical protein
MLAPRTARTALMVLALALSGPPQAAETPAPPPFVVADTERGQLTLDAASLATEGAYTRATLTYRFKQSQRLEREPRTAFTERRDLMLVDCAARTWALARSEFIDDGAVREVENRPTEATRFAPAAPESLIDKVVTAVCAAPRAR